MRSKARVLFLIGVLPSMYSFRRRVEYMYSTHRNHSTYISKQGPKLPTCRMPGSADACIPEKVKR